MSPLSVACCRMYLVMLALLQVGCSLAIDPDRPQCARDTDCTTADGFVCLSGLCTRPACASDQECAGLGRPAGLTCQAGECAPASCVASSGCGVDAVCDVTLSSCTARSRATCRTEAECTRYEGMTACVSGLCVVPAPVAAPCSQASECPGASPTKQCTAGVCGDPTWGCVGQPDNRPLPREPTATLRLRVVDVFAKPVPGLTVTICQPPWLDPACSTPADGTVAYDPATGDVTLSNIGQNGKSFRVKIDPPAGEVMGPTGQMTRYLPMDYYLQRSLRDTVDERNYPVLMLTQDIAGGWIASARQGARPDFRRAHIVTRIFGCNEQTVGGVRLELARPQADVVPLYVNEDGLVATTVLQTDPSGSASLANIGTDSNSVEVIAKAGDLTVSRFAFTPLPGRLAHVHLFPRIYERYE